MKVIAPIVATLASSSEIFDDGSPSLLQLRKATHSEEGHHHKQQVFFNSSHEQFSGHSFGCTGRQTAQNVIRCVNGGDVHEHRWYGGDPRSDWNGLGWYWMAKSIDGSFGAQAFVRQGDNGAGWATMSHFAFKFGDTVVFIDRDSAPDWEFKYYWNGVEKSRTDCPVEVAGVYWSNRGQTDPDGWAVATGATSGGGAGFWGAAERHSCWEYQQVALWTGFQDWRDANLGPYAKMGTLEIEGETTYLDENYGQCARDTRRVSNDEMLVTPAQNDKVCSDNGLTADQCGDPNPQIPLVPPASHLCEFNGVSIDHANLLCAGQEVHGQDVFDDCVYDVCATIDADEQQAAAGGAAMEAAMMNPRAVCALHPDNCRACNICSDAQQVDLSNPVQNNLGGAGPDSGVEELRYANAMTVNGRSVDVVLVAQTAYATPKPERNGFKQGGFGRFTIRSGTTTEMQFLFQDSETRAPVSVENIALTFYDLDEAIEFRNREGRQRETITACQAEEIYLTEDTELARSDTGLCTSFTSTTIGNGQDNPRSQGELTMTQAARSVTYEFHARASISWTASVTGSRSNPRPVVFSFSPQVACGASDSETPCSGLPYHFGGAGDNECRPQSVAEADCLAAVQNLLTGQTQGRTTLVAGEWDHVPPGCSTQSGGDWAAHYNRRSTGVNDGSYTTVCINAMEPPLDLQLGDAGANQCRPANVDEANCLQAVQDYLPEGQTQGRTNLVAGSWNHVPPGCSTQSGGDWAAHFNRLGSGVNDGSYTLVPQMSTNEQNCLYAVQALNPPGTVQGRRGLVAGSWDHVPPGCSTQSGGDWAAHYNRRGTGTNDGGYTMVCKP